ETLLNLIEAEKNDQQVVGKVEDDGYVTTESFFASGSLLAHTIYKPVSTTIGKPLLIAHGFLGSRILWDSVARAITKATNRVVITFDTRHHGDSPCLPELAYELMVDDVLNLTHHLKIKKFSVLGHSTGGNTLMAFALKHSEMIEKMVVVDVSPFGLKPIIQPYVEAAKKITSILENSSSSSFLETKEMVDTALEKFNLEPAMKAYMLANLVNMDGKLVWYGKPSLDVIIRNYDKLVEFPKELLDYKFGGPTLFIKGENSGFISKSSFATTQNIFTNAQLSVVPNAGHFPHAQNFEGFMLTLLPFISA
ncbi:Alpha/beta hydrolase domain-containing protein 11, partial [Orchesella cincta]